MTTQSGAKASGRARNTPARSVSSSSARLLSWHAHLPGAEADAREQREDRGEQLGLGRDARFTPDVHVPLEMLALAAARHALVAPVLGDGEPAQRQAQRAGPRHHHARDRRRHLGAQREVTVVHREVVELLDDLLARLAREQLRVLDDRRIDLLEAHAPRHFPELREEPAALPHLLGIEVARAARRLERRKLRHRRLLPPENSNRRLTRNLPCNRTVTYKRRLTRVRLARVRGRAGS